MKTLLALLLLVLPVSAAPIEIFDIEGRKIIVEIISFDGKKATVKREDDKEFTIPVERLRKDSIDLIATKLAKMEAEKPSGMVLTNTIIKQVGGKFRYFFDLRNQGTAPWQGSVEVTLHNTMKGVTNAEEVFEIDQPIDPKLGKFFYIEIHTGPRSVHADASVKAFSYVLIDAKGNRSEPVVSLITTKTEGF